MENIGALIMPANLIGKVRLPDDVTVVQLLPQTASDIANGHIRLLVEGPRFRRHTIWDELQTYTLDNIDAEEFAA